jgi:hypothetical protein
MNNMMHMRKNLYLSVESDQSVVLRMFTINDYTESREDRLMI